jgi:hypothetical protein
MFEVEVCPAKRIALVGFHTDLSARDFDALNRFRQSHEPVNPGYHAIFDFTRVTVNNTVIDAWAARGQLPQTYPGYERYYVAPQHDLKLMVRLYIGYQMALGVRPSVLVESLDEALRRLGADRSEFRKVGSP